MDEYRPQDGLFSSSALLVEGAVARFEAAWLEGPRPAIDDYLPPRGDRRAVLLELVHVDLECRLKAGDGARVEHYLHDHPELLDDPDTVVGLVVAEYQLRRRQEPGLSQGEYRARFPHLADAVAAALQTAAMKTVHAGPSHTGPRTPRGSGNGQGHPSAGPAVPGYELIRPLGQGGMGVVYLARQVPLRRVVALKMILSGDPARFRTEAEALARLRHPNIVQIYEVGEQDGRPYFSMEYLEGGTFEDQLDGTPQEPGRAAAWLEVLARAMHAAHQQGVIHRDLKPSNILLAADGTLKVTDFGLAKHLPGEPGASATGGHTATGDVLGTPSYMPPEQAAGHKGEIGPRSDVYALGAILYECLTGRPPFKGISPAETLLQVLRDDPVPPRRLQPRVHVDLETICLKCLEKAPASRYQSALDLADDLARFRAGEPVRARPLGALGRAARWARRRPAAAALLASLAVAALGLAGLLVWHEAEVRARVDAGIEAARKDQRDLRAFRDQRNTALFNSALFTGFDLPVYIQATEKAARAALALYHVKAGQRGPPATGSLADPEKAEVTEQCYELLLVLAEALSRGAKPRPDEALALYDRADALGYPRHPTRAYHERRARCLRQAGRPEADAEEARGRARSPATALDHFLLGEALHRQARPTDAARHFQEALRLQADHFWAQYFLALQHLRQDGRAREARIGLTACQALQSDFVWVYIQRSLAALQLRDLRAADADFRTAQGVLHRRPNAEAEYALFINRSTLRTLQNNSAAALADLRHAIRLQPDRAQAYLSLAALHVREKRPDEAARAFDQAVATATRLHSAGRLDPSELATAHSQRAHFRHDRRDEAGALADLEQAIKTWPAANPSPPRARDLLLKGMILHGQKKHPEARTAYEAALKAWPEYADAHSLLGELLLKRRSYEAALASFDSYLRHGGPPTVNLFKARAEAHLSLRRYRDALADYTDGLRQAHTRTLKPPQLAQLYADRGGAYLQAQAPELALGDFDAALERDSKSGAAHAGKALACVRLGRYDQAVEHADRAADLVGKDKPGGSQAEQLGLAASVFAQVATTTETDPALATRQRLPPLARSQDRSLTLLEQALDALPGADERASFWKTRVAADSTFNRLRTLARFRELEARHAPPR